MKLLMLARAIVAVVVSSAFASKLGALHGLGFASAGTLFANGCWSAPAVLALLGAALAAGLARRALRTRRS